MYIRRGFDEANELGNLAYAGYCRSHLVTNALARGEPLSEVEREAAEGLDFGLKREFDLVADATRGQLCMIRALRGLTFHAKTFDDDNFSEAAFEGRREVANLAQPMCWYWIRKLQARVFAEDYASALEAAAKADSLLWTSPAFFEQAEYHYYAALAHAGASSHTTSAGVDRNCEHRKALLVHLQQMQVWAEACPQNFENRAALMRAELARMEGRHLDAQRQYDRAIQSARDQGFIHHEALACETAARFYRAQGFGDIADMYLTSARDGYLRWGADGKVRQLESAHPNVAVKSREAPRAGISPDDQLDVAAVVKASQALSSEMLLPRMIERLMAIALQNAGANRGLLILPRHNEYYVEAEARTEGEGFILNRGPAADGSVPDSVIRYVLRTQETVILEEAGKHNRFSRDPYFSIRRPRSVLCLALVRQGILGGLLYLENTLASHVFTADRARLLEILAAQAAISLENGRLYADLQEREARIRRLIDTNIIGIVTWRLDGSIIESNEAFRRIIGYEGDDCPVLPGWKDLMPGIRAREGGPGMDQLLKTSMVGPTEGECVRRDGSLVPVLVGAALFEASPREGVAFIVDLTDRKRAEELHAKANDSFKRFNRSLRTRTVLRRSDNCPLQSRTRSISHSPEFSPTPTRACGCWPGIRRTWKVRVTRPGARSATRSGRRMSSFD